MTHTGTTGNCTACLARITRVEAAVASDPYLASLEADLYVRDAVREAADAHTPRS